MLRRYLILYLVFFLGATLKESYAQSPVFKNYNTKNGLPSSEIYDVLQDSNGYMWFASDRGVCRYDGYAFKTFTSSDGLPDNTVFRITADSNNRLWFHTYTANVGFIQDNKVHRYAYSGIIRSYILNSVNTTLTVEEDGTVWLNMLEKGIFKLIRIDTGGRIDTSLNNLDPGTKRIYITEKNKCLVTGRMDVEQVEIISLKDKKVLATCRSDFASLNPVVCRTVKGRKYMWIDNDVFLLEKNSCVPILRTTGKILSFMIDDHEHVWIGYRNKGIEVHKPTPAGYVVYQRLLDHNSISCLYKDRNGGIWATALENGFYYLPPRAPLSYTLDDGLPVSKALQLRSLDGNAVVVLSNYDLAVKKKNEAGLQIIPNTSEAISDVLPGRQGEYYLLSGGFNPPLPGNAIRISGYGKLIAGDKFIWNLDMEKLRKLDRRGRIIDAVDFGRISMIKCVFELKDGSPLIGTLEGLYRYDSKSVQLACTNPLLSHRISDVKRLDEHHLLVATMGYGLVVVNEDDCKVIAHFTVKDGLPSVMCHVVYCENDSTIWLGTNKGLCRIRHILGGPKARFTLFDIHDGLISNEINDILLIDDTLWVATMNGISLIPLHEAASPQPKHIPVYLEKVLVEGQPIDMEKPLSLPYDQNEVSFYFIGLDYQHTERLVYKYRLSPIDKNWNYTSDRAVIYKSLAPGNYTFELETVNSADGISGGKVLYSFEILRPFWTTWWFISLGAIMVVLGGYFLVQSRVRFVQKQAQLRNDLSEFKEKALRAQMNPHFIYNSLSSIQSYILNNEVQHSVSMLSKFSRLMRLTFSNTSIPFVPLKSDIEALYLYAQLENQRFNNTFRFEVEVDPALNADKVQVPPLIIQPFVENALLHGLVNKKEQGVIRVSLEKTEPGIQVKIHDNGIGRKRAAEIKNRKDRYRNIENSGISVTRARIEQLWGRNPEKSMFVILDLYEGEEAAGTLVTFVLPIPS